MGKNLVLITVGRGPEPGRPGLPTAHRDHRQGGQADRARRQRGRCRPASAQDGRPLDRAEGGRLRRGPGLVGSSPTGPAPSSALLRAVDPDPGSGQRGDRPALDRHGRAPGGAREHSRRGQCVRPEPERGEAQAAAPLRLPVGPDPGPHRAHRPERSRGPQPRRCREC